VRVRRRWRPQRSGGEGGGARVRTTGAPVHRSSSRCWRGERPSADALEELRAPEWSWTRASRAPRDAPPPRARHPARRARGSRRSSAGGRAGAQDEPEPEDEPPPGGGARPRARGPPGRDPAPRPAHPGRPPRRAAPSPAPTARAAALDREYEGRRADPPPRRTRLPARQVGRAEDCSRRRRTAPPALGRPDHRRARDASTVLNENAGTAFATPWRRTPRSLRRDQHHAGLLYEYALGGRLLQRFSKVFRSAGTVRSGAQDRLRIYPAAGLAASPEKPHGITRVAVGFYSLGTRSSSSTRPETWERRSHVFRGHAPVSTWPSATASTTAQWCARACRVLRHRGLRPGEEDIEYGHVNYPRSCTRAPA